MRALSLCQPLTTLLTWSMHAVPNTPVQGTLEGVSGAPEAVGGESG